MQAAPGSHQAYMPQQCSDDDEECLRPSLLRKQRQPKQTSSTPDRHCAAQEQSENITPNLKRNTPAKQRVASNAFGSPSQQTPFAPVYSDYPQSAAPSQSCLSPGAEYELFGTPITPPEPNSVVRRRRLDSPTPGKTSGRGLGVSKALAHINQLQREHAQLTKQLEEHKLKQQHAEEQLQDADFLEGQLQQLRGPSASTTPLAESSAHQTGSALQPLNQLAAVDALEPWQQLSSENSISNEAQQLEELQSQLSLSSQLQGKESEVVALTIQLVSLHTEVDQTRSQHAETARQLYSAHTELAESAKHLKAAQSQLEKLDQQLASAHQHQTELISSAADAETALKIQLEESDLQGKTLSKQLEQSQYVNTKLGSQLQHAQQQLEQLSKAPVQQETALLDHLQELQAEFDSTNSKLADSLAANAGLSDELQQARQQIEQQLAGDKDGQSALLNQLQDSQVELQTALASLKESQAARSQLTIELETTRHELSQLSDAHATDESTMLDELSQAQDQLSQAQNQLTGTEAELQHEASQLACSLAEQSDLRGQLEQLRGERDGLEEAHEMAEATLLDQLTQAQAELEQSQTQVRHLQQRHQEMCQQLTFARVGQAEAMQAATASKQQLTQQQQAAQSAHLDSTLELDLLRSQLATAQQQQHTVQSAHLDTMLELDLLRSQLATAQQQLQHSEAQHAAANKEHSQSGMQRFELSQRLLDAQTQLSRESQHGAHMQAKLKKHKAKQHDLRRQLESAKLELAKHSEQQAQALSGSQPLAELHAQLQRAHAEELAEAQESYEQLRQKAQSQSEEAESALIAQLKQKAEQQAQLSEQLQQKDEQQAQLSEQLQASSARLDDSQAQLAQTLADGLALQSQLADVTRQLEQSCRGQAESAIEAQRATQELQALHLDRKQLASSLAEAESANEALSSQLKELHSQGRKFKAKLEQLAVKSARYDNLHRDLAEAQAQLAAECAHRQMPWNSKCIEMSQIALRSREASWIELEQQKADRVVQKLLVASSSLGQALYHTQPAPPSQHDGARLDLSTTADQVCSLVEALLTHAAPARLPPQAAGDQAVAVSSRPVDALRTHVSEAQARASQIVHEFESMLLVTGAPPVQQATQMQPNAGLAVTSPDASRRCHKANSTSSGRRDSAAVKATRTCSTSSNTSTEPQVLNAPSKKDTWQPTKSSATCSKENRAPALTYVTGGQVRGARKPSPAVRQPLKQSVHSRVAANTTVAQTGKAGWTPAHRSKA